MYYLQRYITHKEPEYDNAPMILKDDVPLCRQFFIDELKAGLSLLAIDGELSFEDSILFDSLVMDRLFYYFRIYCISKVSDAADTGMDMIKLISAYEVEDKLYLSHIIDRISNMCERIFCGSI